MRNKACFPFPSWTTINWTVFSCLVLVGFYINLETTKAIYHQQFFEEDSDPHDDDFHLTDEDVRRDVDRNWCPNAECLNSPLCYPCHRRFLIIIASARSASTTLTWMMDMLPGIRMGGEINNAINHLRILMNKVTAPPFMMKGSKYDRFTAWYRNPIPDGSLACVSQKLMETLNPPLIVNGSLLDEEEEADEIVGFKTIRLAQTLDDSKVDDIADFLKSHFPCARYLINYRSEVDKQAQSRVRAFREKKEMAAIERDLIKVNKWFKTLHDLLGDQSMLLDSSKWTEDISILNEAVAWLGFDETTCAFPGLLELNTGRRPKTNLHRRRLANAASLASNHYSRARRKKAKKLPSSFQHGRTSMQMNPECKYVGSSIR